MIQLDGNGYGEQVPPVLFDFTEEITPNLSMFTPIRIKKVINGMGKDCWKHCGAWRGREGA